MGGPWNIQLREERARKKERENEQERKGGRVSRKEREGERAGKKEDKGEGRRIKRRDRVKNETSRKNKIIRITQ